MGCDATTADADLDRLRRYLHEQASDGEYYCKSKFLADDLGRSPKEIGSLLATLREADTELEIERWAYTNATTWRVTRTDG